MRERWRERMDVYRAQGAEIEEPDWDNLQNHQDEEDEYERLKREHKQNPHLWKGGCPEDGGEVLAPGGSL